MMRMTRVWPFGSMTIEGRRVMEFYIKHYSFWLQGTKQECCKDVQRSGRNLNVTLELSEIR